MGGSRPAPGHADPLLLTAGQLRRIALTEFGVQADPFEHLVGGAAGCPPGLPGEHRNGRDIVDHPLMWHQPAALDHVADAQAQLDRVDAPDVAAVDGHGADEGRPCG